MDKLSETLPPVRSIPRHSAHNDRRFTVRTTREEREPSVATRTRPASQVVPQREAERDPREHLVRLSNRKPGNAQILNAGRECVYAGIDREWERRRKPPQCFFLTACTRRCRLRRCLRVLAPNSA
jgi:hypothetical protein